jgi:hypothetical protein
MGHLQNTNILGSSALRNLMQRRGNRRPLSSHSCRYLACSDTNSRQGCPSSEANLTDWRASTHMPPKKHSVPRHFSLREKK